ncbi:MAG: hypothetical protein Q8K28_09115 [Hoeflea sp.]|uniref:hypothetical protein n=1 Tax=Hoeflea sp. TaxID=1940281 RepID=UPI0027309857|nr:hypothetical protein [Hoeflea sp.]MDP2120049.1 hypothetical protein [Hoeflea sp.]
MVKFFAQTALVLLLQIFLIQTGAAATATWVQKSREGAAISPGFPHRDTSRVVVYRGRVILSGGYQYGGTALQDLYWSGDGFRFNLALATTPYPVYTPLTVHDDKLFAVGSDKIRTSVNMTTWTAVATTQFADSLIEASLVGDFNGRMFLFLDDKIRHTADGVTWEVASVPWTGVLRNYSAIKHDGYIFVFGGSKPGADPMPELGYADRTSVNKVWRTDDPINGTWTEYDAPWAARLWPQGVSSGGNFYMVGGYNNMAATNHDGVWRCTTVMACERLTTTALYLANPESASKYIDPRLKPLSYSPRHWPAVFSLNGRVMMCAGNRNPDGPGTVNDCWELQD